MFLIGYVSLISFFEECNPIIIQDLEQFIQTMLKDKIYCGMSLKIRILLIQLVPSRLNSI